MIAIGIWAEWHLFPCETCGFYETKGFLDLKNATSSKENGKLQKPVGGSESL